MISRAKQQYYEQKLVTDQKTCFRVVSELLDTAGTTLPDSNNNQNLCDDFAKFFSDKITLIRENIQRRVQDVDSSVCEETARSTVQCTLCELAPTTEAELIRILTNSSDKTCSLDAIPTNLIKKSGMTSYALSGGNCQQQFQRRTVPKCTENSRSKTTS